ncbi:MAG: hypothetical protein M1133_15635 [Armatimonadetes bacterium]|nr:hypothetical protein [Armatimonadota bacterium]
MVRITPDHSSAISIMVVVMTICLAAAPTLANEPSPQYRNISPLPGGGTALNAQGEPDGQGSVQINIPVAYTPHWGYLNTALYNGAHEGGGETDNGAGFLEMGFGGRPSLYVSGFLVGRNTGEAKVLSLQTILIQEKANVPAIAFGVQDLLNKEHSTTGRTYYGVATKSIRLAGRPASISLGFGDSRFLNQPFGGLSVALGDQWNAIGEYDGFQPNVGVTYRPHGRYGNLTFLAAFNGKTGWLVGLGNTFDIRRR